MIHATAAEIGRMIANDHAILSEIVSFINAVSLDIDADLILAELPAAIAKDGPFADEAAIVAAARRSMLTALHALHAMLLGSA
jgi:hypothetical protein